MNHLSLRRLLELKSVARKGWLRFPIPEGQVESVADHSFGVGLLCWLLCPPELDLAKVLEMSLLHDLPEVITGDITPQDGVGEARKRTDECLAMGDLLRGFERRNRGVELLQEYHLGVTPEARFVKGVDKLEMGLQSLSYEAEHPVDLREFRESARQKVEESGLGEWLRP